MTRHIFNLRLSAYKSSENNVATLEVQALSEDGWEPLDLNITTPRVFWSMSIQFLPASICFCAPTAQNAIWSWRARGEILVETSEDWHLENIDVKFDVNLVSGNVEGD